MQKAGRGCCAPLPCLPFRPSAAAAASFAQVLWGHLAFCTVEEEKEAELAEEANEEDLPRHALFVGVNLLWGACVRVGVCVSISAARRRCHYYYYYGARGACRAYAWTRTQVRRSQVCWAENIRYKTVFKFPRRRREIEEEEGGRAGRFFFLSCFWLLFEIIIRQTHTYNKFGNLSPKWRHLKNFLLNFICSSFITKLEKERRRRRLI